MNLAKWAIPKNIEIKLKPHENNMKTVKIHGNFGATEAGREFALDDVVF